MGESVGTPQLGIISESSRFGRLSLAVPALFLWIALTDHTILQLNPPNHARPRSGGLKDRCRALPPAPKTSGTIRWCPATAITVQRERTAYFFAFSPSSTRRR